MSNLNLPAPEEVGINIPPNVNQEIYMEGFRHGLESNVLTLGQMKTSFRLGFRAAKIYLRELAKKSGTYEPQTWRFSIKPVTPTN